MNTACTMRWGAVLSLVAGGLMSAVCYADADGKKEVTWSFLRRNNPPSDVVGTWGSRARAEVACAHGHNGPHPDAPGANGSGNWNGMNGFGGVWVTDSAAVPHATGEANIRMSADAAVEPPPPENAAPQGFTRYHAKLTKDWNTKLTWGADVVPGSSTHAWVHGESSLSVGSAYKWELTGQVEGAAIRPRSGKGDGSGPQAVKTKNGHTAKWIDPISIRVINDRTQEYWEQELFRLELTADFADGSASWEINDNAITLRAGGGDSGNWLGSVGLKVSMNSAWRVNAGLLDPGDHFAWIGGGTAGTSGLWSSLWTSTIDPMGRATAMTLDLSKVNWDVQYVIPDSILNDGDTYTRVLSMTEEFEERGGDVIPTPGTISLLGAGVMVLATAGRRR